MICSSADRRELRLPLAAGYILAYMEQYVVGFLHLERKWQPTLVGCLDFFSHENAFHLVMAQHVLLNAAVPPHVEDSAIVEIHEIFIHPFFQPVKILLPDSPANPVDHYSLLWFDTLRVNKKETFCCICEVFFFYSPFFWIEVHVNGKNFYANTDK